MSRNRVIGEKRRLERVIGPHALALPLSPRPRSRINYPLVAEVVPLVDPYAAVAVDPSGVEPPATSASRRPETNDSTTVERSHSSAVKNASSSGSGARMKTSLMAGNLSTKGQTN